VPEPITLGIGRQAGNSRIVLWAVRLSRLREMTAQRRAPAIVLAGLFTLFISRYE